MTGAVATGRALRLLVVDDDVVDRLTVRRTLGRTALAGAEVREAEGAAEALALLADDAPGAEPPFDCVLLDYEMPGHTGLDVLRRLAAGDSRVPVVMLTGQSDAETAAALVRAGATDFLTKGSLTPARLEQSIRAALRVARSERELAESRELLATTLRSIADAVVTVDPARRVTYLNPAAERLTGWAAPEAVGRPLEEVAYVVAAESDAGALEETLLHARVQHVLDGRRADERADMTLVTRDGAQLYVDATVTPQRDGGRTTGAVVALRDITARKRAEASLAAANRALQEQATELEQQAAELEQQFEEAQVLGEELAQANAELQEALASAADSEARYRALIEASAHLVWRTDAAGRIAELPEWSALTGQSEDESRGDGWLAALHPDDRAASARAWAAALEARSPLRIEFRVRVADGSYRWYRSRGVAIADARGAVREWVGTMEDIDEERRAEDARREEADLVETLHRIGGTLSSELDLERLVQTVTDAATQLTGAQFGAFFYNRVNEKGESYTLYTISGVPREHFSKFPMPRNTHVFDPTFRGLAIVRADDITKDARYGHNPPYHGMPEGHLPVRSYLAVPVISRDGEVMGGLFFGHSDAGVFTDRAERLVSGIASSAAVAMDNARLYEAERRARADAQAANKAKGEFLANMSHELRTPLNAIGGYADLVLEGIRGPITEAQRADIERIKRSQHHLLGLINDILNFARVEAGRVTFDLADVPIGSVLDTLETLVAPQLAQKALRYEYRQCDDRLTAYADGERLQQILLNLLSNAVKFTPRGGTIEVSCEEAGDVLAIRVRDTGVGIPADKLESIFEPFVQLDRGQAAHHAGTGLGLAISRDLARAMGGDLSAASVAERGSTFTLTVPRRAVGSAAP